MRKAKTTKKGLKETDDDGVWRVRARGRGRLLLLATFDLAIFIGLIAAIYIAVIELELCNAG